MPQAVWTGTLSFGLVNVPVKLYSATTSRDVRFHQFEAETGRRIRYRRVAHGPPPEATTVRPDAGVPEARDVAAVARPADVAETPPGPEAEPEVTWDRVVKGYEIEPGRVVTVTPEELFRLAPERSRVLEVERFIDLRQIDPVHFEKSYYVVPQPGVGADRPYWLLFRTMEAAGRVAIGRFVMRTREYLAAVRPGDQVLLLETLFYADEVRDPKEIGPLSVEEPGERELRVARQLIEALAADWDGSRHRDAYRERVLEFLRSKAGEAFTLPEAEQETAHHGAPSRTAADLMEALKASVEAARRAQRPGPARRTRRTG